MNHKQQREADILSVACKVFREKGFHNARMAQIAKESGVSYGLVYHYYKNKADLFDAIIAQWWGQMDDLLEDDLAADRPLPGKLESIIRYFLDQYESDPDLVYIFIMEVSRSTENLTEERLADFKRWISRTEEMFALAQKKDELRTDIKARYLATFFLGALETFISTMVLNNQPLKGQKQKSRIVSNLLDHFFNGARPGKPTSPTGSQQGS